MASSGDVGRKLIREADRPVSDAELAKGEPPGNLDDDQC
jgi:hypothetical protein